LELTQLVRFLVPTLATMNISLIRSWLISGLVVLPCIAGWAADRQSPGVKFAQNFSEEPLKQFNSEWAQWGAKGGSYWIENNVWNVRPLIVGRDYTQSVSVDPMQFPNGTILTWRYPVRTDGKIYAYPEIIFGQTPHNSGPYMPASLGLVAPGLKKANQFSELSAEFDLAAVGKSFSKYNNIAIDIWLTADDSFTYQSRKFELFIAAHLRAPCGGTFSHRLRTSSFNADVWIVRGGWSLICFDPGKDVLSGNIRITEILADLIARKLISGEEYIGGIEFGVEPGGGTGTVTVNKFNVVWK
jgi:hypothetical protein